MVASSAAKLASARLLLHEALGDVWAACTQGTPVTDAQRSARVGEWPPRRARFEGGGEVHV